MEVTHNYDVRNFFFPASSLNHGDTLPGEKYLIRRDEKGRGSPLTFATLVLTRDVHHDPPHHTIIFSLLVMERKVAPDQDDEQYSTLEFCVRQCTQVSN